MTKNELELKVIELQSLITKAEIDRAGLAGELDKAKADLQSIDKPKINKEFVETNLVDLIKSQDLSKFIL